jgi:hypothetical protein
MVGLEVVFVCSPWAVTVKPNTEIPISGIVLGQVVDRKSVV